MTRLGAGTPRRERAQPSSLTGATIGPAIGAFAQEKDSYVAGLALAQATISSGLLMAVASSSTNTGTKYEPVKA